MLLPAARTDHALTPGGLVNLAASRTAGATVPTAVTLRGSWEDAVRPRPGSRVLMAVLATALLASGCGGGSSPGPSPDATIRFAAYDFSENQILAEVYAQGLRRAALPVTVQPGVGTREVVEPALEQGVSDVVVDYLGTALEFVEPSGSSSARSPEDLRAALADALGPRGLTLLDPSSAEDQNGFAVSTAFAAAHGVTRLSDLVPLAPGLTFGGPPECPDRPLCLPGLRRVYGLGFGRVQAMASRAATAAALEGGQIDVGLLETTDARLASASVVLLADDRGLQPHENVVPLVRSAVLRRWGSRMTTALNDVSERLTTAELVRLNLSVEVDGLTPAQAAARWWAAG
jgi:osmoprotectant transport system substrate-binding protein